MKLLLKIFFLTSCICNLFAQENYTKLPYPKSNCPIILVNDNIVSGLKLMETKKELINDILVLVDKPNRKEHKFYNLTENGIIFVKLNKKIPFKTQVDLNKFFELGNTNKVYVNGYLLESKDYKIATESIFEIELVQPNPENGLNKSVLNIWTITKNERKKGCSK